MGDFQETNLWQSTLGRTAEEESWRDPLEFLRTSYLRMRERAGELAAQIAIDFPELTDHGLNHLDALWEMGDLIAGDSYQLNPAEVFVFGGAVLLHDLGLATAAYPGGRDALEAGGAWRDALALVLVEDLGRSPTEREIDGASEEVKAAALKIVLRKRHADQAEQLGLLSWKKDEQKLFLLDSSELRSAFGGTIGRIARSHWSEVGDLPKQFPTTLTAPVSLPSSWTVDQVSVACLLRVADAAHLDKRRAPDLTRAVRNLSSTAAMHWAAQGKIHQPTVKGDRLEYTSGESFGRDEAQAWWLCLELLRNADRELREVDALLEDSDLQRFRATGVRGVDDPDRMATYIRTEGWLPVNAVVHISDVNRIVEHLGGEQLYGRAAAVGIRELIQNGIDAVRARRQLESRGEDWGKIAVEIGEDDRGHWIQVTDTGIGMSPVALTGVLLDFGKSLWCSPEVAWELPGLVGGGFQSIGKFGIGFFSVFMLGKEVRVASRRFDRGLDETNVLEFTGGIEERPLMRKADVSERLHEGGTSVRVWLRTSPEESGGILSRWAEAPPMSLEELCAFLAPASPVDIEVVQDGAVHQAVKADDWKAIDPEILLRRLSADEPEINEMRLREAASRVRTLALADGTVLGRACIAPRARPDLGSGAIVVGGLRATSLGPFQGLLVGEVLVAARNSARPVVPASILSAWATEQGELAGSGDAEGLDRHDLADLISRCGGDSGPHAIAVSREGGLSFEETVAWLHDKLECITVGDYELRRNGQDGEVELSHSVLAVESGHMVIVGSPYPSRHEWPEELFPDYSRYDIGGCDWKLVKACCVAWSCQPDDIELVHESGVYGRFRGGPLTSRLTKIRRRDPRR